MIDVKQVLAAKECAAFESRRTGGIIRGPSEFNAWVRDDLQEAPSLRHDSNRAIPVGHLRAADVFRSLRHPSTCSEVAGEPGVPAR